MSHMSDTFLVMTSPPLDQRLHCMISADMKHQIELAAGAPGFRNESDVIRYALEQIVPGLIEKATERYAGRTRMLVDTAAPTKRVASEREPVRLRDAIPEAVAAIPAESGKCWHHDYEHLEYVCTCVPPRPLLTRVGFVVQTRDQELGYVVEGDPFASGA